MTQLLFDTLLNAVAHMRALQIDKAYMFTPAELHRLAAAEREVDDLVQLHQAPSALTQLYPQILGPEGKGGES